MDFVFDGQVSCVTSNKRLDFVVMRITIQIQEFLEGILTGAATACKNFSVLAAGGLRFPSATIDIY